MQHKENFSRMSRNVTYEAKVEENRLLWRPSGAADSWAIYPEKKPAPLFLLGGQAEEPLSRFTELGIVFHRAGLHKNNAQAQVQLVSGKPVKNFAETWGGLGLCEHSRPWNHGALWGCGTETSEPDFPGAQKPGLTLNEAKAVLAKSPRPWIEYPRFCKPHTINREDGPWQSEPLAAWVDYALSVVAIRNIVWRGRNKKPAKKWTTDLLKNLCFGAGAARRHFQSLAGEEAEEEIPPERLVDLVHGCLDDWRSGSPLRTTYQINPATWRFQRFDYVVDARFGIFPAIAEQLLYHLRDPIGGEVAECSECQSLFILTSRISSKRQLYCEFCRAKGIPHRHAQMRYRTNSGQGRED
jgi:hypothetical protein